METLNKIWAGIKKAVGLAVVTLAVVLADLCMAIIRHSKVVKEMAEKTSEPVSLDRGGTNE